MIVLDISHVSTLTMNVEPCNEALSGRHLQLRWSADARQSLQVFGARNLNCAEGSQVLSGPLHIQ